MKRDISGLTSTEFDLIIIGAGITGACLAHDAALRGMSVAVEVPAVKYEMAYHLDDIVFRRTGLGTLGNPGLDAINHCAELMGNTLGWDRATKEQEISYTMARFIS